MRKRLIKILKTLSVSLLFFLIVLVGLVLSLQIPAVQNFIKDKAVVFLQDKLDTQIQLDKIYVSFPNDIVIENFYVKGKDVDTLLFVNDLNVGIYLPDLIKSKVNISNIAVTNINANINRNAEGKFNFDFILDAFATEDDPDKESKPFLISLDKIDLKQIAVTFNDDVTNNYLKLHLNQFKTKIKTFDLQENNYAINSILIDGFKFSLNQKLIDQFQVNSNQESTVDSISKPLQLEIQEIALKNFDVSYQDENSKMDAHVVFESFFTKIKSLNLSEYKFEVDQIALNKATLNFNRFSLVSNQNEETKTDKTSNEADNHQFNLLLNQLKLNQVAVVYNDNSFKPSVKGLDFNHLNFSNINTELNNFVFNDQQISGRLSKTQIKEKSGLQIDDFSTQFLYGEQASFLKELYLKTPKSIIRDEIVLRYHSKNELSENIEKVEVSANISNSKIAFSDILLLVPSLANTVPFNSYSNATLAVDSKLNGTMNHLKIKKLMVSGLGNAKVNAYGTVINAMNPSKLWVDLKVNQFAVSDSEINNLVPKGTIPKEIQLPKNMNLNGSVKGGLSDIFADLNLNSTFGNARLKLNLNQQVKNHEAYNLQAQVTRFHVGKLIKNDAIGEVSASLKIVGKSFDLEKANATVLAQITSAKYNAYTYKDFSLNGNINKGAFEIDSKMDDPNVLFDLKAVGKYKNEHPELKLDGNITKIDLYKTGFFDETLAVAGKISADFSDLNPDALNGNLSLHDVALAYKTSLYPLTDVNLTAVSTDEKNAINFESQVFNVNLGGKYKLTQLASHLKRNVNAYFNLNLSDEELTQKLEPAYFNATVLIKNDDIISKFLPELDRFQNIELVSSFNSEENKIKVQSAISELIYGDNVVKGIDVFVENDSTALNYNFSISGLENTSFQLNKTSLNGNIKDNTIAYDLQVFDLVDKPKYELSGKVISIKEAIEVVLDPKGIKLNYLEWNVNPANYLQFSDKGIIAHDFEINQNQSTIHIDSEEDVPNSPIHIKIDDFAIETITEIIKKDTLLASGIINGNVTIDDLKDKTTFITDLNITKLNVLGSNVGNLVVNVDNESDNKLSASLQLSGYENDVVANGFYHTDTETFDLDLVVNQLQMSSLQAFSQQMISDAKGYISGKLNFSGSVDKPSLLGSLKFNEAALHVTNLNATFNKINDEILFTNDGISFKNFTISDTDSNSLSLNGNVLTKNYRDFKFDLSLLGKGFKLVNSNDAGDNMVYGIAALDVNLNITGNSKLPKVNGNLKVTDQTDFTFVMPQSSPALQEREGIIEFVDQDQIVLEETIQNDEQITNSEITGLDVSVNIEVVKDAKMAIVLDKINNDVVKIQGEAQLTGGIDPSGKTTLVGTYEVNQGTYDLSVNLIKRKFEIQQGSTIIWTGEPTKANIDITAVYNIKAAPLDLVQQQLNSESTQDLNVYKQKLPFETLLLIKGDLMKPEISFNIELNQDNANVSNDVITTVNTKLEQLRNQESELNKQVLALLIFNRFIGDNPFDTNVNVSASSLARQSVSKLLSQQLNNLASDLISGFDISFDLESQDDYTTGEKNTRTDLNIGVSKTLFHDRLKVTVGSNFGLEGEARENEQTNNIAGDVSVEYKLSKNGRYLLRAYRVNEYQVALQGEVVETGLGFIINLDYNTFKDILRKKKNTSNTINKSSNQPVNESK